jgi:hypothetical protein
VLFDCRQNKAEVMHIFNVLLFFSLVKKKEKKREKEKIKMSKFYVSSMIVEHFSGPV